MFVIKYDTSGNFQWLRRPEQDTVNFRSETHSASINGCMEGDGSLHWLSFMRKGSLQQYGDTVRNEDFYILKFSEKGNYQGRTSLDMGAGNPFWLTGSTNSILRYDEQRGRYYVGGINKNVNPLIIGTDTIEGYMYLAAFDRNGQVLWKKESDNKNGTTPLTDFALDEEGSIYFCGFGQNNEIIFNGVKLTAPGFRSAPYIAKLSPSGNLLWARLGKTTALSGAHNLAINNGEVAITGFQANLEWRGPNDDTTTLHVALNEGLNAFIARFDTARGDLLGLAQPRTNFGGESEGYALTADKQGRYYVGGNFSSQIYLGGQRFFKVGSQRSFFVTQYACDTPFAGFSTARDSLGWHFSYRGTAYDSLHWDFGDGRSVSGPDSLTHIYTRKGSYQVCATAYNAYCGDTTWCDTVQVLQIGLPEKEPRPLEIYPNPARERLVIENPGKAGRYILQDMQGRRWLQGNLREGSQELLLDGLSPGLYVLRIDRRGYPTAVRKIRVGEG